ncbi:MAG: recombination mediator RecR [Elusimicrobiota bacterium]
MKSFDRLVGALRRLPGVGPKQAERLAIHVIRSPLSEVEALSDALREAKSRVHACADCMNYTENERCALCEDPARDRSILCVVEQPADVTALERSRSFAGLYHVLHGQLAPLSGIGPESLRVAELIDRVKAGGVREVILATDPDTEGEATALYLRQLLKPFPVKVSRIAQGVPLGGDLDYMDEGTLSHALVSRRELP